MKLTTFLLLLMIAVPAGARTWRVNTSGTGDAPTLHAAMDSAAAYDTVLVEAGAYEIDEHLVVPDGVQLVGESGPGQTLIYRNAEFGSSTVSMGAGTLISGVHVRGNTVVVLYSEGAAVQSCIVEASTPTRLVQGQSASFQNCLLLGGEVQMIAAFVACIIASDLGTFAVGSTFFLNDVVGSVIPQIDLSTNGNFSLDPQFCGISGSGNYFLQSESPCLPENNPGGIPTLVGPLGVGCGTVRTEQRTWGSVKALYR